VVENYKIEKWSKEKILGFIERCRKKEGIPVFRTTHRFSMMYPRSALAICSGGIEKVEETTLFKDVPSEDFVIITEDTGDWRVLVMKYAGNKKLEELMSYPVRFYLKR